MTSKYVSLASIIERVYRGTEYENIPWQDAAEDVIDVIRLIGAPMSYFDRTTNGQGDNPIPLVIDNYKGMLPSDLVIKGPCRLIQLNGNNEIIGFTTMHESQDIFFQSPTTGGSTTLSSVQGTIAPTSIEIKLDIAQEYIDDGNLTDAESALQGITDDIRTGGSRAFGVSSDAINFIPKYKIVNGYMYTNFKYGFVEMTYKAYPLDELGMPMIPDEIRYIMAVEWYLTSRMDFKRWRTTRNSNDERIYNHSDREALWYIGSARMKTKIPSLDMMESIKNMLTRSIIKLNEHKTGFKNTDHMEQREF